MPPPQTIDSCPCLRCVDMTVHPRAVSKLAMRMRQSLSFNLANVAVQFKGGVALTEKEMCSVAISLSEFKLTSKTYENNEISTQIKASNGKFITMRELMDAISIQETKTRVPSKEDIDSKYSEYRSGSDDCIGDDRHYEGLKYDRDRDTYEVEWWGPWGGSFESGGTFEERMKTCVAAAIDPRGERGVAAILA